MAVVGAHSHPLFGWKTGLVWTDHIIKTVASSTEDTAVIGCKSRKFTSQDILDLIHVAVRDIHFWRTNASYNPWRWPRRKLLV